MNYTSLLSFIIWLMKTDNTFSAPRILLAKRKGQRHNCLNSVNQARDIMNACHACGMTGFRQETEFVDTEEYR